MKKLLIMLPHLVVYLCLPSQITPAFLEQQVHHEDPREQLRGNAASQQQATQRGASDVKRPHRGNGGPNGEDVNLPELEVEHRG